MSGRSLLPNVEPLAKEMAALIATAGAVVTAAPAPAGRRSSAHTAVLAAKIVGTVVVTGKLLWVALEYYVVRTAMPVLPICWQPRSPLSLSVETPPPPTNCGRF